MTTVSILPVPNGDGDPLYEYEAIAGDRSGKGSTPGQALDAIAPELAESPSSTLIVLQSRQPDQFFTAGQRARLDQLMIRWRKARDAGGSLAADEQAELDDLVQAEVRAAGLRAGALADELSN